MVLLLSLHGSRPSLLLLLATAKVNQGIISTLAFNPIKASVYNQKAFPSYVADHTLTTKNFILNFSGNMNCDDGICRVDNKKSSKQKAQQKQQIKNKSNDSAIVPIKESNNADNNDTNNDKKKSITIKIDIISDTMCPWCWVGKRNLEQALKTSSTALDIDINATIEWLPFFLDKDLPDEGKPVKDYYRDNYGNPSIGEQMKMHLVQAGKICGIDFESKYIHMTHYRPTILSHVLIDYAKEQNKQDQMVEALFDMYYCKGKQLNSINDLLDTAAGIGLDSNQVKEYLQNPNHSKQVYLKAQEIKHLASGVPTFLFSRPEHWSTQKPVSFSGGQPPEAFLEVFEYLAT